MKPKYLSYDEYVDLGGTLGAVEFGTLESEAEYYIDRYTHGRLKTEEHIPASVKPCAKKIIGLLETRKVKKGQSIISSESNDGVSVSYNTLDPERAEALLQNKIKSAVYLYLAYERSSEGVPLIFGGVVGGL